jgi:outer membrane protein assembly factor BamB
VYHSHIACIKDGSLIWYRPIEGRYINVLLCNDGNLVAFTRYESRIYKINPVNGDIIWEKDLMTSGKPVSNIYWCSIDNKNNITAAGINHLEFQGIRMTQLSASGDEIWAVQYSRWTGEDEIPGAIITDESNNIYFTAMKEYELSPSYIVKFSSAGEPIWEYQMDHISNNFSYLFLSHSDHNGLFFGGLLYDDSLNSNSLIMKLSETINLVENDNTPIPKLPILYQNYPNPFNPSTHVDYEINEYSHVTLKLYDIIGNEIAVLVNEEKYPGRYSVQFNVGNLSSGVYLYKLQAGNKTIVKNMLVIK